MKNILLSLVTAVLFAVSMAAQTISVTNAGGSTEQISASAAGTMTYSQTDGTLTIGGQAYQATNIDIDTENANIPTSPVAGTTDAAKRVYRYFRNNYGKKVLSSVMADVAWNNTCADKIKKNISGKWPAMNCYDFIHIQVPDGNGWIDYSNITPVTEWVNAGGIGGMSSVSHLLSSLLTLIRWLPTSPCSMRLCTVHTSRSFHVSRTKA